MELLEEDIKKIVKAIHSDFENGGLSDNNFLNTEEYIKANTLIAVEEIVSLYTESLTKTMRLQTEEIAKLKKQNLELEEYQLWATEKIDELENKMG